MLDPSLENAFVGALWHGRRLRDLGYGTLDQKMCCVCYCSHLFMGIAFFALSFRNDHIPLSRFSFGIHDNIFGDHFCHWISMRVEAVAFISLHPLMGALLHVPLISIHLQFVHARFDNVRNCDRALG